MPNEADVLDVCAAAGFDAKAYLVIETIHKLLRFDKKGYALKDLNKALEQLARLRDIVQAEYDSYHEKQRERNRSGEVVFVPFVGPSGEVLCGHGDKPCPNPDRCRKQGCQQ